MNKEKNTNMSGASALPLVIILGLIAVAGYFLLKGEIRLPFLEDKQSVKVRRLDGFPVTVPVTEEREKSDLIIKSEEELISFLSSIDKSNTLTVAEKIDFNKEFLIAMSTKNLDKVGNEFKIRKVYIDKEKDGILVSAKLRKPDDSCIEEPSRNVMVDIVAVSKSDKEFEFETLIETFTCSNE